MAEKQNQVESLEIMACRRVCEDVVRHAVKYYQPLVDETSKYYYILHKFYCDDLTAAWMELSEDDCPKNSSLYTTCLNFIFNQETKKIIIKGTTSFNRKVAYAISRNCTNLCDASITCQSLSSKFYVTFISSLTSLQVLDLSFCSFEPVVLMKGITNCLLNLRVLKLNNTAVDDSAIFTFCGHSYALSNCTLDCALSKVCDAECKLRLETIEVVNTLTTRFGLSCLLSHMATLKCISIMDEEENRFVLAKLIHASYLERMKLKLPPLQFQLESVNCTDDAEILDWTLTSCPNLRSLYLFLERRTRSHVDLVLKNHRLNSLESLSVHTFCVSQISTEKFKSFWSQHGEQLRELHLSSFRSFDSTGDLDILKYVLSSCSNLKGLKLEFLLFPVVNFKNEDLCGLPLLSKLKTLLLILEGGRDSAYTVARKLITSAPRLARVDLCLPNDYNILLPSMSAKCLPELSEVNVKFPWQVEEIYKVLNQGDRNVRVSTF